MSKQAGKKSRIMIPVAEVAFALFAILFVRPHPFDTTVEKIADLWPDSDPGIFIHTILPIILYPVFYGVWHFIAGRVAPRHRELFLAVVYGFYFLNIFIDGYIGLAVYRNIANPLTIFVSIILPLVITLVATAGKKEDGYA